MIIFSLITFKNKIYKERYFKGLLLVINTANYNSDVTYFVNSFPNIRNKYLFLSVLGVLLSTS
ncbi:hypothetical protein TOREUM_30927 [Tenacibaculum litoreum]|jgi:hypothetical protein